MCVIIDANVAHLVFSDSPHADFRPVFRWLHNEKKDGHLVYGGHLARELSKIQNARRYLVALQQAGRARLIPDGQVNSEGQRILQTGFCKSNDPHVIALARISGARTLCSSDKELHKDFKNPDLISNPKGCVYQKAEHIRLLRHTRGCPHYRKRQ